MKIYNIANTKKLDIDIERKQWEIACRADINIKCWNKLNFFLKHIVVY